MRLLSLSLFLYLTTAIYLSSCNGGQHSNAATQNLSMREKMYYEQYMVQGRQLYDQYCVNCHQDGELVVNGITYGQPMPANEQLTNIEVAQLLTYISNSWGNEKGYISVKSANEYLDQCNN